MGAPLLFILSAGCQGAIDGSRESDDRSGGETGQTPESKPGSTPGPAVGSTCAPEMKPGQTVLRRLNRDEYDDTRLGHGYGRRLGRRDVHAGYCAGNLNRLSCALARHDGRACAGVAV